MKRDRITSTSPPTRIPVSYPQTRTSPQKARTTNVNSESKNGGVASTNGGQQQTQLKNVIEFIQKTMLTLSEYEKQLQGQFNIALTPTEI